MENYSKGRNVEEEWSREKIPLPNLPPNFLWMQVSAGSKMRNLLEHALNAFETEKAMVWSGSGSALQKVISCAEIVKRQYPVHQITRLCYRKVEENWDPQLDGLEPLVVKRDIPAIHILLSKEPLDPKELGYQGILMESKKNNAPTKPKQKRNKPARHAELLKQFTKSSK